jgi:hypothetical protein
MERKFEETKTKIIVIEIIDIILFIFGIALNLRGDLVESIIGGFLDLFILLTLLSIINEKYRGLIIIFFIMECIDIVDLFINGLEVFGWIEVLPLWFILINFLANQGGGSIFINQNINQTINITSQITEKVDDTPKFYECKSCGNEIEVGITICEMCGEGT